MPRGGPAPKPSALRIIEGNRGHQKLNKHEPKPRPITPTRPEWLLEEAKHEWSRIVPELERMGLLTIVDRAALTAYCQAFARAVQAEAVLTAEGMTFKTPNGYTQQRPEVSIAMKEWHAVRAFASEFGLTPAARTRIQVSKAANDDDMSEFFD